MTDEMEHLPTTRHRATQPGCRLWGPLDPLSAGEKDAVKDSAAPPALPEPPSESVENKPD